MIDCPGGQTSKVKGAHLRNFDSLDTNSFKAFWAASETLNFTTAAKQVGLTQSGISQHISRLEKQLGVPLFERVNKRVFLTEAGKVLRTYVDQYLDQMEDLKDRIQLQNAAVRGVVSYAMPDSCLMTPHLPMLLERRRTEFPGVRFNVSVCANEEIIDKILSSEIQFGFFTKKVNHPALKLIPYCQETYVLVSVDRPSFRGLDAKSIRNLPFVAYPGVDVLFDHWRQTYFPAAKNLTWDALDIAGTMNTLNGAIHMVEGGVGLSVIPEHCVQSQLEAGSLFAWQAATGRAATNTIYLATLADGHHPRRMQKVMETFMELVK